MITAFDFNPSKAEIETIFYWFTLGIKCGSRTDNPTKEWYIANILPDWAIFDIARLLESRGKDDEAAKYWKKIPLLEIEFLCGKDDITIPVE